jgi:hypothetical protein
MTEARRQALATARARSPLRLGRDGDGARGREPETEVRIDEAVEKDPTPTPKLTDTANPVAPVAPAEPKKPVDGRADHADATIVARRRRMTERAQTDSDTKYRSGNEKPWSMLRASVISSNSV